MPQTYWVTQAFLQLFSNVVHCSILLLNSPNEISISVSEIFQFCNVHLKIGFYLSVEIIHFSFIPFYLIFWFLKHMNPS